MPVIQLNVVPSLINTRALQFTLKISRPFVIYHLVDTITVTARSPSSVKKYVVENKSRAKIV